MVKLILRSGGFINYFLSTIAILCGWAFIATLGGFIKMVISGNSVRFLGWVVKREDMFLLPFALIIFLWMIYYFIFYIISNKIVLENDKIQFSYFIPWYEDMSKWKNIIPNKRIIKINLKKIKLISIYSGKDLEKYSNKKNDLFLKKIIDFKKEKRLNIPSNYICFSFRAWTFEKSFVFLYIILKNNEKYLISLKPFSKRGSRKLLKELELKGLRVRKGGFV